MTHKSIDALLASTMFLLFVLVTPNFNMIADKIGVIDSADAAITSSYYYPAGYSATSTAATSTSVTTVPSSTSATTSSVTTSGVVTTKTSVATSLIPVITQTLKLGDKNEEVVVLQKKLINEGYLPQGTADGLYGNQTLNAVKTLQTVQKLNVDGIVGTQVRAVVNEPDTILNKKASDVFVTLSQTNPKSHSVSPGQKDVELGHFLIFNLGPDVKITSMSFTEIGTGVSKMPGLLGTVRNLTLYDSVGNKIISTDPQKVGGLPTWSNADGLFTIKSDENFKIIIKGDISASAKNGDTTGIAFGEGDGVKINDPSTVIDLGKSFNANLMTVQANSTSIKLSKVYLMGGRRANITEPYSSIGSNDIFSSTSSGGTNWKQLLTSKYLDNKDDSGTIARSTQWPQRFMFSSAYFNDKLWVIGGMGVGGVDISNWNDSWSSVDGVTWKLENANTPWASRGGHSVVSFNGKMFLYGGGTLKNRDLLFTIHSQAFKKFALSTVFSDMWSSSDGVNWKKVDAKTTGTIGARYGHASLVYNNKMWIIGGQDSSGRKLNDVWSSTDGITWTKATLKAPWSGRSFFSAVVFNNKMWVIGGESNDDIWSSSDGKNWTLETSYVPWVATTGHKAYVFYGKLWVVGGETSLGSSEFSNLWSSTDGKTWTEVSIAEKDGIPFDPRISKDIPYYEWWTYRSYPEVIVTPESVGPGVVLDKTNENKAK
jgi:hypothetical protein